MAQRGSGARFMANAWVFPGGVVDELDGPPDDDDVRWKRAALRELVEEVGIWVTTPQLPAPQPGRVRGAAIYDVVRSNGVDLDVDRLVYFANWVTPTVIPVRFDTRFFATTVDPSLEPDPDPGELRHAEWIDATEAVRLADSGRRIVPQPTTRILRLLADHDRVDGFMQYAAGLDEVPPVQARGRVRSDGSIESVLPGEPGYDDLADAGPDIEGLTDAARVALASGHLTEVASDEG